MRTFLLLLVFAVTTHAQWENAVLEPVTTGPDVDTLGRRAVAVDALGGIHLIIDRILGGTDHNFSYTMKPARGDWTAPINCGNYNTKTKKCVGAVD